MTVASLLIAGLALVLAYLAWSRVQVLSRDLAQVREQHTRLLSDAAELRTRLANFDRDAQPQTGAVKFQPAMTIAEAMQKHPGVTQVLADFHLGGCSNCAVSDVDTLEGACRSYGIDQDALMGALNRLLAEPADSGKPIKVGSRRIEF